MKKRKGKRQKKKRKKGWNRRENSENSRKKGLVLISSKMLFLIYVHVSISIIPCFLNNGGNITMPATAVQNYIIRSIYYHLLAVLEVCVKGGGQGNQVKETASV